ncbi:autolysin modifier protein, partial [Enterococcus casseliflavus]|nr:autolysin modifier protein [Enterococcus casseliflavus]
MNNKFSKKVTGLLLISHLTLSALPINAMATEKTDNSSGATQERIEAPNLLSDSESTQSTENDHTATNGQADQETEGASTESEEPQTEVSTENSSENNEVAENDEQAEAPNEETSESNSNESSEDAAETHSTRASVQVTSDAELRTALANATVTQISLANNITMTSSVTWRGTRKSIEGNGHTLTFSNGVRLYGDTRNQVLNIANIRIISHATNTIYQNKSSSVVFNNVTHENSHTVGRLVYFDNSDSSVLFSGINYISGGALVESDNSGMRMTITENASVFVNNQGTERSIYFDNGGQLNLEPNSRLEIIQNNPNNSRKVVQIDKSNSRINVASEATLKIESSPNNQKTQEALGLRGSLTLSSNAILDIESRSTNSTICLGESSTFHEGSNVRIQNNNPSGSALGSYSGTTGYSLFSSKGMQTWNRGSDFSGKPTHDFSNFRSGSFSLDSNTIKQSTSRIQSNDTLFVSTFRSAQTGKIAFGDFVDTATIQQTTIDDLTTNSTHITGRAEPNAEILIKVGDTIIANGRVGSDGKYSLAIEKQQAGTVVTAQARLGDIESNIAETTVIREGIDETTISELNTDSTSVTGTAEPNAEITIKAGDTIIANGRVGSDGIYALTIEKQQAGTVVTAQATLNG